MSELDKELFWVLFWKGAKATLLSVIIISIFVLFLVVICRAEIIDMEAIKMIESSGNQYAVNYETECYGLYQISRICLEDFNKNSRPQMTWDVEDLLNPEVNTYIANWYFNKQLPKYLLHYKIPINTITLIASYNWGVGNVVKWYRTGADVKELPRETQKYLKKYARLKNGL